MVGLAIPGGQPNCHARDGMLLYLLRTWELDKGERMERQRGLNQVCVRRRWIIHLKPSHGAKCSRLKADWKVSLPRLESIIDTFLPLARAPLQQTSSFLLWPAKCM